MNKKTRQFVWYTLLLIASGRYANQNVFIIFNKVPDWYNYLLLALEISMMYYSLIRIHKTL